MSRGSAFARVIGMTKSLSPLSFDRNRKDDGHEADETAADPAAGMADDSPSLPPAEIGAAAADFATGTGNSNDMPGDDMLHAVEEAMKEEDARPVSGTVTPFPAPALARVTVVANAAQSEDIAAKTPPLDQPQAEISGDMIEAIETDMASLLASLNRLDDAAPPEAAAVDAASDWLEEDEVEGDQTLALLSELNRMWQADPIVSGEPA